MGVRGRNSDNTLIRRYLNWEPSIRLEDGIEKTYRWIFDQITNRSSSLGQLQKPTPRVPHYASKL